jgi:hypothetical protein
MSLPLLNNRIQRYVNSKLDKESTNNEYKILSTFDVRNIDINNDESRIVIKSDNVNGLNTNKTDDSYASIEIHGSISDLSNMIIIRPDKSDTSGNITVDNELDIDLIDMKEIITDTISINNIDENTNIIISNNNKVLNIDGLLTCNSIKCNDIYSTNYIQLSNDLNTYNVNVNNLFADNMNTELNPSVSLQYYNNPNTLCNITTRKLRANNINYYRQDQNIPTDYSSFNIVHVRYNSTSSNYNTNYIHETYYSSDPRFKYKETIIDSSFSSNIIQNIQSYQYKYKKEKESNQYDYGFMADEVQRVLPDAVYIKPTMIDIENTSCSYEYITDKDSFTNIQSVILKHITDNEFDTQCQFYMMNVSCDFSSIPIRYIHSDISQCVLDTMHDLNYIGQYKTDHIREYLYTYKDNIRIRINDEEYVTKIIYDQNQNTNRITIDTTDIPITNTMTILDIYRPIECVTYISDVIEVEDNEDNTRNYRLNITSDVSNELKKIENGEMIWYKVNVKDGKSLDYRKIFMQYHNILKDIDTDNNNLKEKINNIYTRINHVIEQLNINDE